MKASRSASANEAPPHRSTRRKYASQMRAFLAACGSVKPAFTRASRLWFSAATFSGGRGAERGCFDFGDTALDVVGIAVDTQLN